MILLGVNQTLQLQGPAFHCQLRRKRLFWVASLLFVFLVLLEQAYLLNSPNVVNCNDNLLSSDKSHSALRTTWRYDHQHYWHISKIITSRSFKSFPRWELLGEAATVWEGGVLDLCASVGFCQNAGNNGDALIWTRWNWKVCMMVVVQVLLHQGGIYLDTDIVLTKKLPISQMQNAIAYEMYDGNTHHNNAYES